MKDWGESVSEINDLKKKHKLRVFDNMVLGIFGPRKDEVTGNGGDCITRS